MDRSIIRAVVLTGKSVEVAHRMLSQVDGWLYRDCVVIDDPFWGAYLSYGHPMRQHLWYCVFLEITKENVLKLLTSESEPVQSLAAKWIEKYEH